MSSKTVSVNKAGSQDEAKLNEGVTVKTVPSDTLRVELENMSHVTLDGVSKERIGDALKKLEEES